MYNSSVAKLDLSDKYLTKRWCEVKEDFWGDLKRQTIIALRTLLETNMEVQVQDLIGSRRWEHNAGRSNYRNGCYSRGLLSSFGYMRINVPRVRVGGIKINFINKYERRTKEIDQLILGMFLNGVATRKVEEVLEPLLGRKAVSAGLVSKITKVLDKQVRKFHTRKLTDKYEYLLMDGIYLNTKSPVYKKRRCILAVYGLWTVNKKIRRELIDFQMATKGESENAWFRFINGLYYRGLKGERLKLITRDGNEGLANAIETVYPMVLQQHCWRHKLENVSKRVPRKLRDVCIDEAKKIYKAGDYKEAVSLYRKWAREWKDAAPKAVKCLDKDIEELLNFYQCPDEFWVKLRTTNIIERSFREVRRRTRPMSCFQNRESVERIIYAIFCRMNKKWGNDVAVLEDSLFHEITQDY